MLFRSIILEEIQTISEEEQEAKEQPQEKTQTDVSNMLRLVPKIDNAKEYSELLTALMKHDFGNDQQKATILKKLRDMINQLIK